MNKLTDLTLGIKKCAFIAAQILEDREPDFLPCRKRYKDSTYINKSFNYNEYYQCADYVYETFENFYNEICGKKKKPIRLKNKSGMGKISHFGLEGI